MSTNARALSAQRTASPQVVISSRRPALRVAAMLDTANARITGGYGGWEVMARPRARGFTEWRGIEPARMSLPLILDGFAANRDQEPFIRNLERMARPERATGDQPPLVRVTGAIPAAAGVIWVIENIEWGERIIRRRPDGHRVRQDLTLTLLQHVAPDLAFTRSAAQRRALTRARLRTITAAEGDTMAKIAVRELGAVGRWTQIRDANPALGTDARKAIAKGTRVRVPTS